MSAILELLVDPQMLLAISVAIGVAATILTVALPMLEKDQMASRIRAVALEREAIRARERARLGSERQKSLRAETKPFVKDLVDKLNLKNALSDDKTADQLRMAGFRGQTPLNVYLFARFVGPFACFLVALFYFFVLNVIDKPPGIKFAFSLLIAAGGMYLPNFYIKNAIQKRQLSIKRAWPDALDLMLICIESGMSVEPAFRKVAEEIGSQSIPLAEEMSLTAAELSYLQERRKAYENLAARTGLETIRSVVTALIQAERYGTPLGQAIRVLSQESRDTRMAEAEKKAASLPPKLTVPMIIFFLPVLFAVIIGPAMIQLFHWK